MTLQLFVDNQEIEVKKIKFSDGSSSLRIVAPNEFKAENYISIAVLQDTPADNYLWELCLIFSALNYKFRNLSTLNIIVDLPYLPHARADRVFEDGNPFPLEIFFSMLSDICMFENLEVYLIDPHSDYYKKWDMTINFNVKTQKECFFEIFRDLKKQDILIAPDKGAAKKAESIQEGLNNLMVYANKNRDIETGRVISVDLPHINCSRSRCIIVDDICDGGGTFIPLAEQLREFGADQVELYVTHGIFSKGLGVFKGLIDKIHCYQVIGNYTTLEEIRNFNLNKEVK